MPSKQTLLNNSILLLVLFGATHVSCQTNKKLDCYPIDGVNKEKCESLGCIWSPVDEISANIGKSRVDEPWCYFPEEYEGYKVANVEMYDTSRTIHHGKTHRITLERTRKSALGVDIKKVFVELYLLNDGQLLEILVTDANNARFEPELPKLSYSRTKNEGLYSKKFSVHISGSSNTLTIRRAANGAVLFSTDLRRLIFSDKFIQLNSELNTPFVYGLGEHYDSFLKLADKFKTYSFWNTGTLTLPDGQRSYGGFPFYINLDKSNNDSTHQAYGVYLRNSNAMDIILQKDSSITFRPIGGILDFYMFIGPTPLDVVGQFQQLVGLPDLPPRWALGFHLCRYNYGTLAKTKLVSERTRAAGIPFDVQWNDIDYMDRYNDFTYDKNRYDGLPAFVDELHQKHKMYYMILFDPGLSQEDNYYPYELGDQMDIWIKNATNQTLVGKVWNQSGRTVFPDFSNPISHRYWSELFVKFHSEIKFDGAWIDMNEISNFVDGSLEGCPSSTANKEIHLKGVASIEDTPYQPGGYPLQTMSLCLSAKHSRGYEYDLHNLYSFYEAVATRKALNAALPKKRSLIISRSTHPGQGHYSGHWSGDVLSTWEYLKWSIPSLIEHSMYGYSMMGSDICGFDGNTTIELCARWSTLGAFYTFSRNHNDDVSMDQDPVALGAEVVAANKNAYTKKYSLLPYFYTLIHRAHIKGEPVARSVAFQFFEHQDKELLEIESQFMIGGALMVSPIVDENTSARQSYLPRGRWYETDILPESYKKAPKLINSIGQSVKSKPIALDNLVLFIRGGHILPVYTRIGPTTSHTVEGQPISLEVALCEMNQARGGLILDDGESIDKNAFNDIDMEVKEGNKLHLTMLKDNYQRETPFGQVKVYGLNKQVSTVKVVGESQELPFTQDEHMIKFDLQGKPLSKQSSIIIEWN